MEYSRELVGIVAFIVTAPAYVVTIVELVGGRTKTHPLTAWMWPVLGLRGGTAPRFVSWFLWCVVNAVIFVSSKNQGASATNYLPIIYGVGSGAVAISAIRYGTFKIELIDVICTLLTAGSIVLLLGADSDYWALRFAVIADVAATVPTFYGLMRNAKSESLAGWSIFLAGSACNMFAFSTTNVREWTFEETGFTLICFMLQLVVVVRIRLARRFSTRPASR